MTAESDVPPAPRGRHLRARDAVLCVMVAALLLVLFEWRSIRNSGNEMKPGWQRALVLAVGNPAGWVSDKLGLADVKNALTDWVSPNDELTGPGSFAEGAGAPARGVPPVTPDSFDPRALGGRRAAHRPLHTLLVTGDSLVMPLDSELARRFAKAGTGVKTVRDPHVGTGISQSEIVDWGRLSHSQVAERHPDAVVVFMGANEGFPMRVRGRQVPCCGPVWAAEYASRARRMMSTYRQGGAARVYWLTLPGPRDPDRQRINRSVNAAIAVAAQPYRAQVRVIDMTGLFTPGGRYRDAMPVGGVEKIVREADGVHLNRTGAQVAAEPVLAALRADYGRAVP